jgi:hypothetical protein
VRRRRAGWTRRSSRKHLRSSAEREENKKTNALARVGLSLDRYFTKVGESIEKNRRAGSSFFQESDFLDVSAFATKLRQPANEFSKRLAGMLTPETVALLSGAMPPRKKRL